MQDQAAAGRVQSRAGVVHLPAETGLIAVRSTGVDVDFSYGSTHMGAGCAVRRFEIEDLLVGSRCAPHRFLARSYDAAHVVRDALVR